MFLKGISVNKDEASFGNTDVCIAIYLLTYLYLQLHTYYNVKDVRMYLIRKTKGPAPQVYILFSENFGRYVGTRHLWNDLNHMKHWSDELNN